MFGGRGVWNNGRAGHGRSRVLGFVNGLLPEYLKTVSAVYECCQYWISCL